MGLDDEGECICWDEDDAIITHSPGELKSTGECV